MIPTIWEKKRNSTSRSFIPRSSAICVRSFEIVATAHVGRHYAKQDKHNLASTRTEDERGRRFGNWIISRLDLKDNTLNGFSTKCRSNESNLSFLAMCWRTRVSCRARLVVSRRTVEFEVIQPLQGPISCEFQTLFGLAFFSASNGQTLDTTPTHHAVEPIIHVGVPHISVLRRKFNLIRAEFHSN